MKWQVDDQPIPDGKLARIWSQPNRGHKYAHHIPIYDRVMTNYMQDNSKATVNLLEIGIAGGGSLQMYREFLPEGSTVVGADAAPRSARWDDPDNNVHVRVGYQQDPEFLGLLVDELGPFDIIIDDASHLPGFTRVTFDNLFINGLTDHGLYLVDDLQWFYMPAIWDDYDDQPSGEPPFTDYLKYLIDVLHAHYPQHQDTACFEPDNPKRVMETRVPELTVMVDSIAVWDSLAVITKGPRAIPRLERNYTEDHIRMFEDDKNPDGTDYVWDV